MGDISFDGGGGQKKFMGWGGTPMPPTMRNHAIYQNNKQTFLKNKEVEPVEPIQINICQRNNYAEDLS